VQPRNALWVFGLCWAVATSACGGRTLGGGDGDGGGSSSSSGGGGSTGTPEGRGDASAPNAVDAGTPSPDAGGGTVIPAVTCSEVGSGGGGGGGGGGPTSCTVDGSETCSDGNRYTVSCGCPAGECFCTLTSGMGGSGGAVPYNGCAACPSLQEAWDLCGFPH
jgi:hypothetical protein